MKVTLANGMVAEIENERDLELLRKLTEGTSVVQSAAPPIEQIANGHPRTPNTTPSAFPEQVRAWRARLNRGGQSDVVQLLSKAPAGLSDEQLRGELGLKSNSQLAGLLGALSRHANAVGVRSDRILKRAVSADESGRARYLYELTPKARAVLNGTEV